MPNFAHAASIAVLVGLAVMSPSAIATDKTGYTLLNPTPRELWRPLSADRPDATESPYTVDAGAIQIELSLIEHTRNRNGGETRRDTSVLPMNLKIGLTNNTDVQLLVNPYESRSGDADGFGDMGLRLKVNLFGNDDGIFAVGFLPFVTFPTGASGISAERIEGGFIVPAAWEVAEGWSLGGQIGVEWVRTEGAYETVFSHSIILGCDIMEDVSAYVEYLAFASVDDDGRYSPSLSLGATHALTADVVLDAGVVIGLDNPRTDDVTVFLGMTLRL